MDKKKYLIRMQSKPSPSGAHLASLGNELNLDEGHDKLLTSSGSSSANEPAANAASALTASTSSSTCSSGPYTEILFKTKSSNEMKRLFGLLQWKDSLNYDDNVSVHISAYKPKNVHLHYIFNRSTSHRASSWQNHRKQWPAPVIWTTSKVERVQPTAHP